MYKLSAETDAAGQEDWPNRGGRDPHRRRVRDPRGVPRESPVRGERPPHCGRRVAWLHRHGYAGDTCFRR
jgi:hypothetical protein